MEYSQFMNRMHRKAAEKGIPLGGTFELTSRCSLDCKMCYVHKREFDAEALALEKSTEWWLALAATCREKGMLTLLLTGGEPMIRLDFDRIYVACHQLGLLVSVNTNATLINAERIKMFTDYPPQRLNISLYGASRDTYESLCGKGEMYDTVVGNILALHKAGVKVKLNFSATPVNEKDMEEVFRFAKELDIPMQASGYMFPPVRTLKECECFDRFSPSVSADVKFRWRRLHFGDDYLKKRFDVLKTGGILEAEISDCEDGTGEKINCRAGKTTFWATWNGKMSPCGILQNPVTELDDFDAAWAYIRRERQNIRMPAKCRNCPYKAVCDTCSAVAFAENGRTDQTPEYVCEIAKEYLKILAREFS